MNPIRGAIGGVAILGFAIAIFASAPRQIPAAVGAAATSTPYHEGFPSPMSSPMPVSTLYPLPAAEDLETASTMSAGSVAMLQASQAMAQAARVMRGSGDPALVDLAAHWDQDARALREQAAWMVLAASADSMVHDPDKAHELNLQNLRGNGMSMAAEGQAMADHGREMLAQVKQLQQSGAIAPEIADDLTAAGQQLVSTGESLVRDGQRMQEYAERLLGSMGQ